MKSAEANSNKIALQQPGLATPEAKRLFLQFGPNEPVSSRRTSGLVQILFLFINPLAIIRLIASAISAAVGEVTTLRKSPLAAA